MKLNTWNVINDILANCGDSRGVFCVGGKAALSTQVQYFCVVFCVNCIAALSTQVQYLRILLRIFYVSCKAAL